MFNLGRVSTGKNFHNASNQELFLLRADSEIWVVFTQPLHNVLR